MRSFWADLQRITVTARARRMIRLSSEGVFAENVKNERGQPKLVTFAPMQVQISVSVILASYSYCGR
jgi:hypothetical protein